MENCLENLPLKGVEKEKADLYEIHKMSEACVQMCLFLQGTDVLEVRVVDVSIDSEKPLEDCSYCVDEVRRKWLSERLWKNPPVVYLHMKTFTE